MQILCYLDKSTINHITNSRLLICTFKDFVTCVIGDSFDLCYVVLQIVQICVSQSIDLSCRNCYKKITFQRRIRNNSQPLDYLTFYLKRVVLFIHQAFKNIRINYKLFLSSIPVLHYAVIILCSQCFYLSMAKELLPFEGLANQGNKSKRVFALYISLILTWFRNYKEDIFG